MSSRGSKYWNSGSIPLIAPDVLGRILAEVADLALVITEEGTILSVLVNPFQDYFDRVDLWEGQNIRQVLAVESIPKLERRLAEFLQDGRLLRPVELNHTDAAGQWEFPIRYTFHRIVDDGAVLLLGHDLRPVAEVQQQLVKAQIAIERDHEAQREFDARFRVLMESVNDAVVFVSARTDEISAANGHAAMILGRAREELVGLSFAAEFDLRQRGDVSEAIRTQAMSDRTGPVRARVRRTGDPVRLVPTMFRAAGERTILCRIEPETAAPGQVDDVGSNLSALYQTGPDAMVFTDGAGEILSANEAFLDLIDAAHDLNVKGRSLGDYLFRGSVDLRVLTENAARMGRMRLYPTRMSGEYGRPRAVEIAATAITAGKVPVFAFVIRDANRIDPVRPISAPVTDDNVRSMMELVGNATLKEIVAETTNVVEKMCIETAVELTMNNRVAAAEMLGLSRQSLYVKLRKYGIICRGEVEDGEA